MNSSETELKNPVILSLDVDTADEAIRLAVLLGSRLGAIKLGPRLVVRYGAELISRLAQTAPIFVDNKYLDIPSTMEHAIRATHDAGATFATVHAWAGSVALEQIAKVEKELSKRRPFKILTVTILTSYTERTLPPGLAPSSIATKVDELADLAFKCGLTGVVCSPQEVASLRKKSSTAFLVTPGVRLSTNHATGQAVDDQKRVETPAAALELGASALVIGRPIYAAADPLAAFEEIFDSIRSRLSPKGVT